MDKIVRSVVIDLTIAEIIVLTGCTIDDLFIPIDEPTTQYRVDETGVPKLESEFEGVKVDGTIKGIGTTDLPLEVDLSEDDFNGLKKGTDEKLFSESNIIDEMDFISGVGKINLGVLPEVQNGLSFSIGGGVILSLDKATRSIVKTPAPTGDPIEFQYIDTEGVPDDVTTEVDPEHYMENGVKTILKQSNDVSFQRLYLSQDNQYYMMRGSIQYGNLSLARDRYIFEEITLPALLDNSVLLGGIILRRNTTDIASSKAFYVYASKFGEFQIGGGGGSTDDVFKSPVADITALKALHSPLVGTTRQILSDVPNITFYTFSTDLTGEIPDDGSVGSWVKKTSSETEIKFIGSTDLGAVDITNPTLLEVRGFVASKGWKDSMILYTGTDISVEDTTHSYYSDRGGSVILLGVVKDTIQLVGGTGTDKQILLANGDGTSTFTDPVGASGKITFVGSTTLGAVDIDNPTLLEFNTYSLANNVPNGTLYYNKTDDVTLDTTHALTIDSDKKAIFIETPSSAATVIESKFIGPGELFPTKGAAPTLAEIQEFATVKTWKDSIISYNGTDDITALTTFSYHVNKKGIVTQLSGKSATPIRVFDDISEVDAEIFIDGEMIITKSPDAYYSTDKYTIWVFALGATRGDHETEEGYFYSQNDDVSWYTQPVSDIGADFYFKNENKGTGFGAMPQSKIVYFRKHASNLNAVNTDVGVTIAADDYRWHMARRVDELDSEYLGLLVTTATETLSTEEHIAFNYKTPCESMFPRKKGGKDWKSMSLRLGDKRNYGNGTRDRTFLFTKEDFTAAVVDRYDRRKQVDFVTADGATYWYDLHIREDPGINPEMVLFSFSGQHSGQWNVFTGVFSMTINY